MNRTIELVEVPDESISIDGQPATPEVVERVLEGFEIRRRNLVPGGKSLSAPGLHSPVLQVRLSEQLEQELRARATEEGVSVSKLARRAIDEFLRSQN